MSSNIEFVNDTLNGGFLCGFVEASVEKPTDGLNGACVVHYAGQQRKCKMKVKLVNGMREGIGTILKKGAPFIQVEYHHGLVTGTVCRMDDYGVVEMRGQLLNGMESGLFEEYDDNEKVVWRGYYRDGKRYSEVMKSEQLEGYYDEKSAENGRLLSIAQYDKDLRDKNGRCLEYENGSLRSECEYENGVKKHTSRQFVNEMMTVFDSNGKNVYEGKWFGDKKSGFLCHEKMEGMSGYYKEEDSNGQLISVSEYDELNVFKNGKCFDMENGKVKRVCVYEKDEMKRVMQEFDGSTMTEYNDGKRVYEGEWKGDMNSGFVREGKGNELDGNERVKRVCVYESGRMKRVLQEYNGKEMVEYDENGKKVYEGGFNGFDRNGNGYCFNVDGKDMEYCLYENGELKRVIQMFTGNEMTENDANGKRVYVGGYAGDMKSGFVRNGRGYCVIEDKAKQYGEFEKGKMKRVMQEFDGKEMTEYNENGVMSYLGEWKGDMKSGFVRDGKGIEYEKDGETALYSGQWMSGKRDGKGTEYRDGHALYTGEWKNGIRNGKGKEMDESGRVVFMGEWKDGKGKGKEMDANGKAVYEGEWWNGKRNGVGEVLKGTRWMGHWKDGKMNGMEYEKDGNGVMKRGCLLENGEMKRVVQEFDGGKMVEYDENGKKVYEGEYKGNVEKGFVREGRGKEYRMVEERIGSRVEPMIEIEKKRFCCWVREIEHEVAGVELVTKKYREEVVEGYWKDGKKNGMIYELDENGKAKRGCLYENDAMKWVVVEIKGSEMVEYDRNGKKVYEGKWFGDMKVGFSCHERMEGMSGYFKEVGSSGQLISVSEYDELNVFKNGKCFDMENGKVKRVCVYEKGIMKRVMQEFNGSIMTEYNNGKRVYEGGFKGDMKNGFVRDGKGYCFDGNGSDMKYCVFGGGSVIRVIVEIKGSVMTEYDDNGKKMYVGGFKGDRKSGVVRNGEGKEMDGSGKVVRSGCWVDGKYKYTVMIPSSLTSNPRGIEELKIGNNGYNDDSVTELKLSWLARLKRVVIGNECFGNVRVFELDGLGELESVEIGKKSFRIRDRKRSDGSYRVVNCPKLKSIQIGGSSFWDYHSFELNNLHSLQFIDMGDYCFHWTPSFSLTDLPQLQSVKLGWAAFHRVHSVVFENLPKLQSIQLDTWALYGDDRKTISTEPYNYKNTLTMRNLPSLTEFKGNEHNFKYIGSVILENIPQLSSSGIQFGNGGFYFTYSLQSSNATALESAIRSIGKYV
ncbi:hypothetical protein WA538_002150 [Blastocystis sp. DL]